MKLAELRREMDDSTANAKRSGRLDKWKELTKVAAAQNNMQLEIPDKLESLDWKVGIGDFLVLLYHV